MLSRRYSTGSTAISHDEKDLWNKLAIFFRLESNVVCDNKITGCLNFVPDQVFKLIEKFEVVTNDNQVIEFNRNYRKISIFGFNPSERQLWIKIRAVSYEKGLDVKESEKQYFFIVRQHLPLTPTVNLCWLNSNDKSPTLIVRWFHIGDKLAELYILSLDENEIYCVRDLPKYDVYQVCIQTLKLGSQHDVEIIARLKDGKETYRSGKLSIKVPDKKSDNENNNKQIINVRQATGTVDTLQDLIDEHLYKSETISRKQNQIYQTIQNVSLPRPPLPTTPASSSLPVSQYKTIAKNTSTFSCRCRHPHTTFPGLDHYFNNANDISDDDADVIYE